MGTANPAVGDSNAIALVDPRGPILKGILITATVLVFAAFTGTFAMWLALKVFGATLGAATALVTVVMSWVVPAILLVGCVIGAIWLFWYWRLEPQKGESGAATGGAAKA